MTPLPNHTLVPHPTLVPNPTPLPNPTPKDENFVSALLRYFHLPLRRFPGVQYLSCCSATSGIDVPGKAKNACFSRACVNRRFPRAKDVAMVCEVAEGGGEAVGTSEKVAAIGSAVVSRNMGAQSSRARGKRQKGYSRGNGGRGDAAGGVANASTRMIDVTRSTLMASLPISGKYRSEVEIAVQHAMAHALPGAHYLMQDGVETMASCHPRKVPSPRGCLTGTRALQRES